MLECPPCLEHTPAALPAAGAFVCTAGAPPHGLLEEAALHFVRLRSRVVANEEQVSHWLEQSPCHRCAWRCVFRAWDLLGTGAQSLTVRG